MEKDEQRQIYKLLNEPPKLSLKEEIANSIIHGIGTALAIPAFIIMIINADSAYKSVSAFFYGISLILFMLMSCLYHAFRRGSTVKRVWSRFMYSSIFLLFLGVFSSLYLVYFSGVLGIVLFCILGVLVIIGVVFVSVFGPGRTKGLQCGLYIAMIAQILLFIPGWIENDINLLYMFLAGVLLSVIGTIFYFKNKKWTHFIWHILILAGCIIEWIGIYTYIY